MSVPSRLLAFGLVAGVVAGCAGPPSSTAQPTTKTTTKTTTTTPTDPGTTTAAPGEQEVVVLPESVLRPLPKVTYSKIEGAPQQIPEVAAKPEAWEGSITRKMTLGRTVIGTVQVLRVRPGVITDEADEAEGLRAAVAEYAATEPEKLTEVRIGGLKVLTAKNVRDTGGSAAGWIDGRDLTIIFARKGLSARKIAVTYITGAKAS